MNTEAYFIIFIHNSSDSMVFLYCATIFDFKIEIGIKMYNEKFMLSVFVSLRLYMGDLLSSTRVLINPNLCVCVNQRTNRRKIH